LKKNNQGDHGVRGGGAEKKTTLSPLSPGAPGAVVTIFPVFFRYRQVKSKRRRPDAASPEKPQLPEQFRRPQMKPSSNEA
jgi:hypothetical protein